VRHAQPLNAGSEIPFSVLDTASPAYANLALPPQPPGTLTLSPPIRRPKAPLPMAELVRGEP